VPACHLAARSIDHLVVERGEVGHSWRTQRWDSLRLLTPNWQARLPGFVYDGGDPDGFMDMAEVVGFLERYARLVDPPLKTRTTVESVRGQGAGYEVVTDRGTWHAATVVLASGGFNVARVPLFAAALPDSESRENIWEEWEAFVASAEHLGEKAAALQAALGSVDSGRIGAAFGDLGKNGCGGCHRKFREKRDS